jgi:hypothetical protein
MCARWCLTRLRRRLPSWNGETPEATTTYDNGVIEVPAAV